MQMPSSVTSMAREADVKLISTIYKADIVETGKKQKG
jgi:hypothetical protein